MFETHVYISGELLFNNVKLENPLYHYGFFHQDLLHTTNFTGYAVYFDNWNADVPVLAKFQSVIKEESTFSRYVRMLLLFHRCDQLIQVPSFVIYRIIEPLNKYSQLL